MFETRSPAGVDTDFGDNFPFKIDIRRVKNHTSTEGDNAFIWWRVPHLYILSVITPLPHPRALVW